MNHDFIFALYVFAMDYHSGQNSRLYRIMSRIAQRGISLRDSHIYAIQGNRHKRRARGVSTASWDEWQTSREFYRQLKRKYAHDAK